jgi:hypothetical protein
MVNAEAHTLWQKHTLYALQLFKQQNVLSQYDAWYQQSVQQWCDDIPYDAPAPLMQCGSLMAQEL